MTKDIEHEISREKMIEAAFKEAGFTYADPKEVNEVSKQVIKQFKPTLDKLKNR